MFRPTRPQRTRSSMQDPGDGLPRRSRRAKKTATPLGGRRSSKAGGSRSAHTQPPVLVRSSPDTIPVHALPRAKSKRSFAAGRRYDVALGVPGAEVRLPSLPSFHLGWHYLSGLLAIALLGLMYYIWTAPMFRIQMVEVRGLQRLSQADVNTVIGLVDEPVFGVDPVQSRLDLLVAFPEMSAITVEVSLPASVIVTVKERIPILAWMNDEQELWVDAEGMSFPPRGEVDFGVTIEGDLPVINPVVVEGGLAQEPGSPTSASPLDPQAQILGIQTPRLDPDLVKAILTVGAQAPKKSHLIYNPEHGLGWTDKRGWQVFFGTTGIDPATMEVKLKIYAALLKRLNHKEVRPQFVSVEYLHAPYYRVER